MACHLPTRSTIWKCYARLATSRPHEFGERSETERRSRELCRNRLFQVNSAQTSEFQYLCSRSHPVSFPCHGLFLCLDFPCDPWTKQTLRCSSPLCLYYGDNLSSFWTEREKRVTTYPLKRIPRAVKCPPCFCLVLGISGSASENQSSMHDLRWLAD